MYAVKQRDREHELRLVSIKRYCVEVSDSEWWVRYGETLYRLIIKRKYVPKLSKNPCGDKIDGMCIFRTPNHSIGTEHAFIYAFVYWMISAFEKILISWFQVKIHKRRLDTFHFSVPWPFFFVSRKNNFVLYMTVFITRVDASMDFRNCKTVTVFLEDEFDLSVVRMVLEVTWS